MPSSHNVGDPKRTVEKKAKSRLREIAYKMDHDALVKEFSSITKVKNKDLCKQLLEACDWDLMKAVDIHFNQDQSEPVKNLPKKKQNKAKPKNDSGDDEIMISDGNSDDNSKPGPSNLADKRKTRFSARAKNEKPVRSSKRPENGHSNSKSHENAEKSPDAEGQSESNEHDGVRAPMEFSSGVLVQQSLQQYYAQGQSKGKMQSTSASVFVKDRNFKLEADETYRRMAQLESQRRHEPVEQITKEMQAKSDHLSALFKPPTDVMFFGDWDEVRSVATMQNRWLLCNIQNVDDFTCQILNRDVWANHAVKDILRENFVFWQVDEHTANGTRFCAYYRVNGQFPYLCIIDPRTGEEVKRIQRKCYDAVVICDVLTTFLCENPFGESPQKEQNSMRSDNNESEINLASSSADSAKILSGENCHAQSTKRKLPVDFDESNETKQLKSDLDNQGIDLDKEMPLQDYKDFLSDEGEELQIIFRLPSGDRKQLALKSSSQLKALHLFVSNECKCPLSVHKLMLGHPKRCLNDGNLPDSTTLEKIGLNKRELVHVEPAAKI